MGYINEDYYYTGGYGTEERSTTASTLDNKNAVCRYYQAGNCRRGASCPFVHPSVPDQMEGFAITHPAYQGERIYVYPPHEQTPVYPHPISQAHSHFLWQPYPSFSPAFDPRYGVLRQPDTLPDYPDDRSDSYSTGSSSTATSLEDTRKALDNLRVGSTDPTKTRVTVNRPGDSGIALSPGYADYSFPVFPPTKPEHGGGRGRATSLGHYLDLRLATTVPSPYMFPWQDDTKRKPLAYKTKPCKFYAMNGKCTSGEKCTFIHDPETDKSKITESPYEPTLLNDPNLPPKPVDKYEDLKTRDFYPITWRVIGGGVMMGGQRQICPAFAAGICKYGDDCRLAHETEVKSDPGGFVELKTDITRKGERSQPSVTGYVPRSGRSSSQKRKPSKLQPLESDQIQITTSVIHDPHKLDRPSHDSEEVPGTPKQSNKTRTVSESSKSSTSAVHRRTQSMTITSPPPHDKAPSAYAAEL